MIAQYMLSFYLSN